MGCEEISAITDDMDKPRIGPNPRKIIDAGDFALQRLAPEQAAVFLEPIDADLLDQIAAIDEATEIAFAFGQRGFDPFDQVVARDAGTLARLNKVRAIKPERIFRLRSRAGHPGIVRG